MFLLHFCQDSVILLFSIGYGFVFITILLRFRYQIIVSCTYLMVLFLLLFVFFLFHTEQYVIWPTNYCGTPKLTQEYNNDCIFEHNGIIQHSSSTLKFSIHQEVISLSISFE